MTSPQERSASKPPPKSGERNFDKKTVIEVSLVMTLIASSFYGGRKMEQIDGSLRQLSATLERTTEDSMTRQEFELFKANLRARNPDVEIPD